MTHWARNVAWVAMVLLAAAAVWGVGHDAAVDIRDAQIRGCERGRGDRVDDLARERDARQRDADQSFFARTAAAARRRDGQENVAVAYDRVAVRATIRANRSARRVVSVRARIVDCHHAFPKP